MFRFTESAVFDKREFASAIDARVSCAIVFIVAKIVIIDHFTLRMYAGVATKAIQYA